MNSNINNSSHTMMPPIYPESDEEEELSGSYNINDDVGAQESDCSDGSSSASSSKTGISSSGSSTSGRTSNLSVEGEDETSEDDDDDEDDDDGTTTQSDELELAQLTEQQIFRLPRGLCENAAIFNEFFSLETWQMLSSSMQAQLQPLLPNFTSILPPAMAAAEVQRTVTQLFNGGVQRFGQSPMAVLQQQLEEGNLRPEVRQIRRSIERSKRRERRFQHCEQISKLAKELFISREQLLRNVYTTPPDDALGKAARTRKRKSPCLQTENKLFSQRARKRYCLELYELAKELDLKPGDISADDIEEDPDAITAAEREEIAREWVPTDTGGGAVQPKPSNAADKKCIYNTFFKRRYGVDDEHVLRSMQAAKIPPLNDKNFKKYLRDYKRRKLADPDHPDFDTTDIRLRDVCTRAQFTGSFKPGRKPKALAAPTATATKQNEPPALVPISSKNEPELLTDEPQQVYGRAAVEDEDEGLDLDGLGYDNVTTDSSLMPLLQKTCSPQSLPIKPLPKLEPISLRSPQQQLSTVAANSKLHFAALPHKALVKTSTAATHITGSPTREQLSADMHMHACYFSLLRDFFVATPNHRMTYAEMQTLVVAWRDTNALAATPPVSPNDWYRSMPDWTLLLQSAINFLSGEFAGLPLEYVPYIEYKTQLNIYQWIGAGRDSDARLLTLCNYWLQRRKELKEKTPTSSPRITTITQQPALAVGSTVLSPVELGNKVNADGMVINSPTPPPRCPTSWTVRAATQEEVQEFQRQERLRFEQPHRPFTYRMHGYESVVGPVKGIYTQTFSLNKARGHAVMVADRPPYVTILTLVRDATARLPNGEGTRAEISELLKCSQYINAAENVLQTIVSGALDRMHAGLDPCVRYDAKRKIWIYLHRNRSEAEFELMHKNNQSVVRQQQQKKVQRKPKPKKEGETTMAGEANSVLAVDCPPPELPALVPAAVTSTATHSPTLTATTLLVKKVSPLSVKCPPVPPLKYNIPAASVQQQQQQQKSLLKSPLQAAQRSGMVTIVDKQIVKTTPAKPFSFPLHSPSPSKISPTRNTTPILVSTPTGLQTVHVATTPQAQTSNALPAAAKKLAIKKPIIISHLGSPHATSAVSPQQLKQPQQLQQVGSFIIPLEQPAQQQPKEQQHLLVDATAKSLTMDAISPRQQLSKNIIRLLPAGANNAAAAATTGMLQTKQTNTLQIIAPRMLAQTTVRPVQQKIGAVSIVSNKPAISNPASSTSSGTIVKMSPQAFATLQHKQLLSKATAASNSVQQLSPQQQQQQRILVGNTAISSNKNIVFQALPPATYAGQTKPNTTALPKILTTNSGKALNTANLSQQQQQRIVLQNFKQQPVQFKAVPATVVDQPAKVSNMTTVSTTSPTTAAVASQTMPRVVRTATSPQTGQIITLDSLLQKQTTSGGTTKLLNANPNIIQLATSSSGTHLISPQRNVITFAPQAQQRLVTTTQAAPKLATTTAGRIITTNAVPKIIGKTTVLPGGKPLVLHAKTLNATGGVTLRNVASTTTLRPAGAATQLQNIVIGGQTVKLQSASNLPRTVNTSGATTTPMQTLIMGNQVLRLQHVSTAGATSITNSISSSVVSSSNTSLPTTSSGIVSAPKTLVIGTGGQTLRLAQSGGLTKNVLVAANKTGNTGAANNVVFAVQGGGGQLFFSPTLQGMNLKPLSNMKVIPMANATGAKLAVATTAAAAVGTTAGGDAANKTMTQKMLPQAVLKTGGASGN